jgi:hypothetical protein
VTKLTVDLPIQQFELPTRQELESQRLCGLIRFVLHQRRQSIPSWIHRAADSEYGRSDTLQLTRKWLLQLCSTIEPDELHNWVEQGHHEAIRLSQWLIRENSRQTDFSAVKTNSSRSYGRSLTQSIEKRSA